MAQDFTLCVGTVGGGLSCSPDGGMTWNRIRNPIPSECNVRALAVYPDDPHRILAGTDVGSIVVRIPGAHGKRSNRPWMASRSGR